MEEEEAYYLDPSLLLRLSAPSNYLERKVEHNGIESIAVISNAPTLAVTVVRERNPGDTFSCGRLEKSPYQVRLPDA